MRLPSIDGGRAQLLGRRAERLHSIVLGLEDLGDLRL